MEKIDRVERLLALILVDHMKGTAKRDKAVSLSLAGFSNVEIADILQTSSSVIAQSLYEARRGTNRTKK
jgi:hypothetical protein